MTPRQRPCRHAASRPPASGARYPAAACTTIRWLRHRQRWPPPAGPAPALLSDGPVQRTARIDRPHRARLQWPVWAGVNGECQPPVSACAAIDDSTAAEPVASVAMTASGRGLCGACLGGPWPRCGILAMAEMIRWPSNAEALVTLGGDGASTPPTGHEIGRASCRERV